MEYILEEREVRKAHKVTNGHGVFIVEGDQELNNILNAEIKDEADVVQSVEEVTIGGPYTSIEDLMNRIPKRNLNKKSLTSLCLSGSLDSFMSEDANNRFLLLRDVFKLRGDDLDDEYMEKLKNYQDKFKYEEEKNLLGVYVSGHVLDRIATRTDWDLLDEALHSTSVVLQDAHIIRTKKQDQMAFLTVDSLEGEQKLILFPKQFESIKEALVPGMILQVAIRAQMNWQRNSKDFIIHTVKAPRRINRHLWKEIEQKTQE